MKSFTLTLLLFYLTASYTFGQDTIKKSTDHYQQLEEKYKKARDSVSLLNPFIPAVSSVMIKNKQVEINFFNSLISANNFRDENGSLQDIEARETYFYNTIQLTYGLSKNDRFNIGLDINSVFGRFDQDRNSSMFKVFNSNVEGNSLSAKAITSIAPRIRWRPVKKNYNFIVQSSISFPASVSTEKQAVLGQGQVSFLTQLLYNQPLGRHLFLFSQLSIQYGFEKTNAPAVLYAPLSFYLSYLIPKKTIVFALLNYVPILTKGDGWSYNRYTLQAGGGIQQQVSRTILINGYLARDIKSKNYPDFHTYNISLRFLIN